MNVKLVNHKKKSSYSLDLNANGLLKFAKKLNNVLMEHVSVSSKRKISKIWEVAMITPNAR
jgi:hypothetical protein